LIVAICCATASDTAPTFYTTMSEFKITAADAKETLEQIFKTLSGNSDRLSRWRSAYTSDKSEFRTQFFSWACQGKLAEDIAKKYSIANNEKSLGNLWLLMIGQSDSEVTALLKQLGELLGSTAPDTTSAATASDGSVAAATK